MKGSNRLFGTNGIRGVVNKELTPAFALKVAEAVGTFFEEGRILVGYDGRTSNMMLADAITSGLLSSGCNVYDVGMAPTPCIQYAVRNHKMDGAIMITASHNPPEFNGVKVMGRDGVEIPRKNEETIERMFLQDEAVRVNWRRIGVKRVLRGILVEYKEAIKYLLGISNEIKQNKNLLPLWTQVARTKNPNGEFTEFSGYAVAFFV